MVVDIVRQHEAIREFWSQAHGWAPHDAADLLAKSRLDRLVSLAQCLDLWIKAPKGTEADGRLILAWANLGSLVEGSMKFLLSVYLLDYQKSALKRKGKDLSPDELGLEQLRVFFGQHVWTRAQKKRWLKWVQQVQQRRNAIHSFQDRDIGAFRVFAAAVRKYERFLDDVHGSVPYPNS